MIPKIIHYCWFGRNPLPESAQKCIASWRKYLPDYEIKEWNEDNFDVNIIPYTKEAYEAKKYAFVSDYARFWVLYKYGGIYFDTDVEAIKPLDDLIEKGGFMGIQHKHYVAPGLGLAIEKGHPIYKKLIDYYNTLHFFNEDGSQNQTTIVTYTTDVLLESGYNKKNDGIQCVDGIYVYPSDFFCPLDDVTGVLNKTKNTRTIHWYSKTWVDNYNPMRTYITRLCHRWFGVNSLQWIKKMINIK